MFLLVYCWDQPRSAVLLTRMTSYSRQMSFMAAKNDDLGICCSFHCMLSSPLKQIKRFEGDRCRIDSQSDCCPQS